MATGEIQRDVIYQIEPFENRLLTQPVFFLPILILRCANTGRWVCCHFLNKGLS
ncbi:hypothetical protein ADIS_0518 [Lunatimonas lonarensis]|uniref:Uncharacterized protein n=1 Tax=Lunatimonas lonarensis TaxID=1232681 RepID=R7ZXP0_9BACT|nr:hypothetical protein ADIS_0518 [Lunatimonas lonarensis]